MKREALRVTSTIPVAPTTLYFAWIDSEHHSSMTGAAAKLEPVVGAKYTAVGGYVSGKLVILDLGRRIVMSWRTTDFPRDAADSRVEVHFETLGASTRILILHTDIPEGQSERYKALWNDKYITPMRTYFSKFLPDPRNPPVRRPPPPPPEGEEGDEQEVEEKPKSKLAMLRAAKAAAAAARAAAIPKAPKAAASGPGVHKADAPAKAAAPAKSKPAPVPAKAAPSKPPPAAKPAKAVPAKAGPAKTVPAKTAPAKAAKKPIPKAAAKPAAKPAAKKPSPAKKPAAAKKPAPKAKKPAPKAKKKR
jgi:uncharacterized protein YndB with AHSA1/START domain